MKEPKQDVITMDGEPLEVGDNVYCLLRGEMVVAELHPSTSTSLGRIFTKSDKNFTSYDGLLRPVFNCGFHPSRTLFWQKPEITPPPKPKKLVKVWDWFTEDAYGNIRKHTGISEGYMNNSLPQMQYLTILQKIDGTEREIEQ